MPEALVHVVRGYLVEAVPDGPKAALIHLEAMDLHNHRNEKIGRIVPAF